MGYTGYSLPPFWVNLIVYPGQSSSHLDDSIDKETRFVSGDICGTLSSNLYTWIDIDCGLV
jgi:hypothetical protein